MSVEVKSKEGVLNLSAAMDNLDGDVELLAEIVEIFMETGAQQIEAIAESIGDRDVEAVAIKAHAMKGGASNFCADRFVAAAFALERLAKGGGLEGAGDLFERMKDAYAELDEVIRVVNWDEVARSWAV